MSIETESEGVKQLPHPTKADWAHFLRRDNGGSLADLTDAKALEVIAKEDFGCEVPHAHRKALGDFEDILSLDAMRGDPDFRRYWVKVVDAASTFANALAQTSVFAKNLLDAAKNENRILLAGEEKQSQPSDKAPALLKKQQARQGRIDSLDSVCNSLDLLSAWLKDKNGNEDLRRHVRATHKLEKAINRGLWLRLVLASLCCISGIATWLFIRIHTANLQILIALLGDRASVVAIIVCAALSLLITRIRRWLLKSTLSFWSRLSPNAPITLSTKIGQNHGSWLVPLNTAVRSKTINGKEKVGNAEEVQIVNGPAEIGHTGADHAGSGHAVAGQEAKSREPEGKLKLYVASRSQSLFSWVERFGILAAGATGAFFIGFGARVASSESVRILAEAPPALGARCELIEGELVSKTNDWLYVLPDTENTSDTERPLIGISQIPARLVLEIGRNGFAPKCWRSPAEKIIEPLAASATRYFGDVELRKLTAWLEQRSERLLCIQKKNRIVKGENQEKTDLISGGYLDGKCDFKPERKNP